MYLQRLKTIINQPHIKKLHTLFDQLQGEIRLVGGCVRDALLNKVVQDIDIATNVVPDKVEKMLLKNRIKYALTGIKHGTITAIIDNKATEITTLRRDITCNGRHATVEFTDSWGEDAARRDFTFNALYCDMEGKIYDYFSGLDDLENLQLNFVGDPEKRICEDYLRILRAFRFHVQLDCNSFSSKIINACSKYANKIKSLSGERIQNEMLRLLQHSKAIGTLIIMQKCQILHEVLPIELHLDKIRNVNLHTDQPIINLAFLLRSSQQKSNAAKVIQNRWKLSKKQFNHLNNLCKIELNSVNQKSEIRKLGTDLYNDMLIIHNYENKISYKQLLDYKKFALEWNLPALPISGDDLIYVGYKQGTYLKKSLDKIIDYWEKNDYIPNKKELIEYAKLLLFK